MTSQTHRTLAGEGRGEARRPRPGRGGAGPGWPDRRGIIYLLIGLVAILVAVGQSGKEADQAGALKLLAAEPFGLVALWGCWGSASPLRAVGGSARPRSVSTGEGSGAGPRIKSAARAVIYMGFAVLTFDIIAGTRGIRPTVSRTGRQGDALSRWPTGWSGSSAWPWS